MNKAHRQLALTLALGLAGAGLATAAGLPAAALIGATLATSAAAWGGLRLRVTDSAWNTLVDSGYQTTANSTLGAV